MLEDKTWPQAQNAFLERTNDLHRQGYDWSEAFGRAQIEQCIEAWPSAWGEDLEVLVYGDFKPPDEDLIIPALGITVYKEKLEKTVIRSAMCVLKARVKITEKSLAAITDAARRINVFLGAWTLVEWGNGACGWWSYVTHGNCGGVGTVLAHEGLERAIQGVIDLPEAVRRRVDAALYWVREPRRLLLEACRSDVLRIYSAYWNAFECLVEAVATLRPQQKPSKSEKQRLIDEFVAARDGNLTSSDIAECYREIVNPGFVGKASHALKTCFPEDADYYIEECFRLSQQGNRLYDIRNAINHGEIDAEHPEELLRVESRLHHLWMIVWRMFGRLIPFPAPADRTRSEGSTANDETTEPT